MFRTLIYPSSGACDCAVELPHWSCCSWFDVCWRFGVVGLEWCPCCRFQHATRTPLQPNHTESPSLQHGHHSNPITPNLQTCNTDTTPTQSHRISKPATRIPLQPNHTESPSLQHGYHSNPITPNLQPCNTDTTLTQSHRISKPATRTPLQPNHTESPTHIEPRTKRPMW